MIPNVDVGRILKTTIIVSIFFGLAGGGEGVVLGVVCANWPSRSLFFPQLHVVIEFHMSLALSARLTEKKM